MIDQTLAFLTQELNAYLRARFDSDDDIARLACIGPTANIDPEDSQNRILVTLINIEREGTASNTGQIYRNAGAEMQRAPQPLNLNLIFLVSANFAENYRDGLRLLSSSIGFFQSHPLFTAQSCPDLPTGIDRLSVEWRDLDLQAIHNLWSVFGARYLPSAVYKARMLIIEDALVGADVPIITGTTVES